MDHMNNLARKYAERTKVTRDEYEKAKKSLPKEVFEESYFNQSGFDIYYKISKPSFEELQLLIADSTNQKVSAIKGISVAFAVIAGISFVLSLVAFMA